MSSPGFIPLISPIYGNQYDAYLQTNSLDKAILFFSWAATMVVMTWLSISNYNANRKYAKDLKHFKLMEESDKQFELANGGGGTSFVTTFAIWFLGIVMSINIYLSF